MLVPLLMFCLPLANADESDEEVYRQLDRYAKSFAYVHKNYFEEIPAEVLIRGALKGMIAELDQHSRWVPAEHVVVSNDDEIRAPSDYTHCKTINPGVGLCRIESFVPGISSAFERLLIEQSSPWHTVVLDLRNNEGGLLSEAINLTDLFVGEGPIVTTVGRHQKNDFSGKNGDIGERLDVSVMVNRNTASAAELFTAALRSKRKAQVVGERTYGKASVQAQFISPIGHDAIVITIERFTVDGAEDFHTTGILPDVVTVIPEPVDVCAWVDCTRALPE